jgi:hypothetical protein
MIATRPFLFGGRTSMSIHFSLLMHSRLGLQYGYPISGRPRTRARKPAAKADGTPPATSIAPSELDVKNRRSLWLTQPQLADFRIAIPKLLNNRRPDTPYESLTLIIGGPDPATAKLQVAFQSEQWDGHFFAGRCRRRATPQSRFATPGRAEIDQIATFLVTTAAVIYKKFTDRIRWWLRRARDIEGA